MLYPHRNQPSERSALRRKGRELFSTPSARASSEHLAAVMEMCQSKGETYDPAEDGFVFSAPQIAAARRLRNRDRRIAEAHKYRSAA